MSKKIIYKKKLILINGSQSKIKLIKVMLNKKINKI